MFTLSLEQFFFLKFECSLTILGLIYLNFFLIKIQTLKGWWIPLSNNEIAIGSKKRDYARDMQALSNRNIGFLQVNNFLN